MVSRPLIRERGRVAARDREEREFLGSRESGKTGKLRPLGEDGGQDHPRHDQIQGEKNRKLYKMTFLITRETDHSFSLLAYNAENCCRQIPDNSAE
jgi:hypothetical protein